MEGGVTKGKWYKRGCFGKSRTDHVRSGTKRIQFSGNDNERQFTMGQVTKTVMLLDQCGHSEEASGPQKAPEVELHLSGLHLLF